MPAAGSLPTAVDTNTRSPHTIGLDTATPATGVFQRMFSPVAAFHFTAVGDPSATPEADGPRNDGQFCAQRRAPAAIQATLHATIDADFVTAYFSPARVKVIALPLVVRVIAIGLSGSTRNVTIVPGCSATPNVV